MISSHRYYCLGLWLPVVVPAVGTAIWLFFALSGTRPNSPSAAADAVGQTAAGIGLYSLPLYAIFGWIAARWLRGRPAINAVRQLAWMAPFVLAVPFGIAGAAWVAHFGAKPGLDMAMFLALAACAVGYAYVAVLELGWVIGRWRRWIVDEERDDGDST